jgi:hypothetical protein
MVPMSLGLGDGGEQNAPLGRAVIGGLIFATVSTLFFVPVVYSIIRGRHDEETDDDGDADAGAPSRRQEPEPVQHTH